MFDKQLYVKSDTNGIQKILDLSLTDKVISAVRITVKCWDLYREEFIDLNIAHPADSIATFLRALVFISQSLAVSIISFISDLLSGTEVDCLNLIKPVIKQSFFCSDFLKFVSDQSATALCQKYQKN